MECEICAEKFNKSNRKKIDCPKCDTKVCRSCFKKYLDDSIEDAHCMACKKQWGRDFLSEVMTKVFLNREYREHRENIMFEQQKALLTSTAAYVESSRRIDTLSKKEKEVQKQIDKLEKIKRLMHEETLNECRFYWRLHPDKEDEEEKENSSKNIRGHCVKENCNGLINQNWKCISCDTKVCRMCMKEKKEGHECNRDDIESLKLIRSDSKPCPNCNVRIHKYQGCNQAWCTQCKTAFNWRTMKIIRSGFFHNPHYAEWQAENGTEGTHFGNNNEAAACLNFSHLIAKLKKEREDENSPTYKKCVIVTERKMKGYLMGANHLLDYETDSGDDRANVELRKLRVWFLRNKINEKEFKQQSQIIDKARNKKKEVAQIYLMYGNTTRDILYKLTQSDEISMDQCIEHINNLYKYTCECLEKTYKWYNPFYKKKGYFTNHIYSYDVYL